MLSSDFAAFVDENLVNQQTCVAQKLLRGGCRVFVDSEERSASSRLIARRVELLGDRCLVDSVSGYWRRQTFRLRLSRVVWAGSSHSIKYRFHERISVPERCRSASFAFDTPELGYCSECIRSRSTNPHLSATVKAPRVNLGMNTEISTGSNCRGARPARRSEHC